MAMMTAIAPTITDTLLVSSILLILFSYIGAITEMLFFATWQMITKLETAEAATTAA